MEKLSAICKVTEKKLPEDMVEIDDLTGNEKCVCHGMITTW